MRVHWTDRRGRGGSIWRVSIEEALVAVLVDEPRDIAVECCSAVMRHKRWSKVRMDAVLRRAPERAQPWRELVSALDDSHGETFMRLGLLGADIAFEQQSPVRGVGRIDFKVGPHT